MPEDQFRCPTCQWVGVDALWCSFGFGVLCPKCGDHDLERVGADLASEMKLRESVTTALQQDASPSEVRAIVDAAIRDWKRAQVAMASHGEGLESYRGVERA